MGVRLCVRLVGSNDCVFMSGDRLRDRLIFADLAAEVLIDLLEVLFG